MRSFRRGIRLPHAAVTPPELGPRGRPRAAGRCAWLPVALLIVAAAGARAGELRIRVADLHDDRPVPGAFVQIGEARDEPFSGNWGYAGADGVAVFRDPRLNGPQTVTAAWPGYAVLTVWRAAVDSITLRLRPEVIPARLERSRTEVEGLIAGITTQANDGLLDLGIVYPAIRLSDILSRRVLPFEVPSDTVRLPIVGDVTMPGNVVLPEQTEFMAYRFGKPAYHLFVPDSIRYDFAVLSGRLPVSVLGGDDLPIGRLLPRRLGIERRQWVHGRLRLDLEADLPLPQSLLVTLSGAPPGARVYLAAIVDLPGPNHARALLLDARSALADTLGPLLLGALNPAGDLLDSTPYLAGYYADSSRADLFQSGRVDRAHLELPASRELDQFYRPPALLQEGDLWRWLPVHDPGTLPAPTWAVSTFRLAPAVAGEAGGTPRTLWEIWVPAEMGEFRLPLLSEGGPGGLPDPSRTPEEDCLLWDCWLADPSGPVDEIIEDPYRTLSRWSRATTEATPPIQAIEEFGLGTLAGAALRFRLVPNPGPRPRDIVWDTPPRAGQWVGWSVVAPNGLPLASGRFRASGAAREAGVLDPAATLPTGVYWVRVQADGRFGSTPLVILR